MSTFTHTVKLALNICANTKIHICKYVFIYVCMYVRDSSQGFANQWHISAVQFSVNEVEMLLYIHESAGAVS